MLKNFTHKIKSLLKINDRENIKDVLEDLIEEDVNGSNNIDEVAWFLSNTESKQPVGKKKPNALGLYDMSGNVWEWCSDWYHDEYFQVANKINPLGPDYGTEKVVRGGSWFSNDIFCDISRRYKLKPDYRDTNFGFRCVKDI